MPFIVAKEWPKVVNVQCLQVASKAPSDHLWILEGQMVHVLQVVHVLQDLMVVLVVLVVLEVLQVLNQEVPLVRHRVWDQCDSTHRNNFCSPNYLVCRSFQGS